MCTKYFCIAILFGIVAIVVTFIFNESLLVPRSHPSSFPKPTRKYWGKQPNNNKQKDPDANKIKPFIPFSDNQINSNEALLDQFKNLWLEREKTNPFKHETFITDDIDYNKMTQIEAKGYGINYNDFHQLMSYYNNTFNWNQHKQQIINQYNHYMVNIQGLNIHFIRHQLNKNKPKRKVQAVMFLHGWPSSFWEYHSVLDVFIDKYKDQQIDIIIPSLPGYGFSEYPMQYTGFTTYAVAEIFRELMENILKYDKYIVIGGDWGSVIAHNIAYSVVDDNNADNDKLCGVLLTMPLSSPPIHEVLLLALDMEFIHKYIADKYGVTVERVKNKYSPLLDKFVVALWDLTGYQHEHATRANTIGIALQSSPISNLAWIYEKYLTWSDSKGDKIVYDKKRSNRVISGELTWDDVLIQNNIFWLNGVISSGIRYYTESIWTVYQNLPNIYIPDSINIGVVHWYGDSFDSGFFDKWNYGKIVMNKDHEDGGHFAALEYPHVFYQDVVEFIQIINEQL